MKNLDKTALHRLDIIKLDNFNVGDCSNGISKERRFA